MVTSKFFVINERNVMDFNLEEINKYSELKPIDLLSMQSTYTLKRSQ